MPSREPPILVVNLDRDEARLRHMEEQLARLDLNFTRIRGVLGDAVPAHLRSNFFETDGARASPLKRGEIGCYASHLTIYARMLDGDELGPRALVLEDDIEIAADFSDVIAGLVGALPKDWDIVRLSNTPKRAYVPVAALPGRRSLVRYSEIPNGTGAYLISRSGARKLMGPRPRLRPIDEDMRRAFECDLNTYGVVPPPVRPDVLASTIDALEAGRLAKVKDARRATPVLRALSSRLARMNYNCRVLGPGRWLGCSLANLGDKVVRRLGFKSMLPRAAAWLAMPGHDRSRG